MKNTSENQKIHKFSSFFDFVTSNVLDIIYFLTLRFILMSSDQVPWKFHYPITLKINILIPSNPQELKYIIFPESLPLYLLHLYT